MGLILALRWRDLDVTWFGCLLLYIKCNDLLSTVYSFPNPLVLLALSGVHGYVSEGITSALIK